MTVPQHSESARLAQLEQRVQALEDVNAIRHLKARYAAYCDDQYNPDGLAALFTEDAVWESQGLGRCEGREAIREFFRGASQLFTFAIHYSLNGQIDVQGDTARAQWYLEFIPLSFWYDAPLISPYSDRRHDPWLVCGSPTYSPVRWSSWISPA